MTSPRNLYQTIIRLGARPLRDARAIHRQIEHHTHPHRTLWATPEPRTLILRTTHPTDWSDWPGAASVHTRHLTPHHTCGQHITYSLIANPTRSAHTGNHPDGTPTARGRRLPITDSDAATEWLHRRIAGALTLHTTDAQHLAPARGAHGLLLTRWALGGTATITDPEQLDRLLAEGVGRGKAFGCGLLLTAPAVNP